MRKFWARRTRREKILVLLALALLFAYFGLDRVLFPLHAEYVELKQQHDELEAQVQRGLELSREAEELGRDLAEAEEEYAEMTALFPGEEDIPALVRNLEQRFEERHVTLERLEPQEIEIEGNMAFLPITVSFSGSRSDLQRLMFDLELFPRYLQLTGADLIMEPGDARGTLAFHVYYLAEGVDHPGEDQEQ